MILKGNQRGGAKQLGKYLESAGENEHVEIHEVRGFMSLTPRRAMEEILAISKGTKCKQPVFSLSLNPPKGKDVPIESFEAAIERIEKKLGLNGQPRVIVFHEKKGLLFVENLKPIKCFKIRWFEHEYFKRLGVNLHDKTEKAKA